MLGPMTTVAERHPRLMVGLSDLQDRMETEWKRSPEFPYTCRALEVLAQLDGVVGRAHVDLPTGILTMAYMEPAVMRDARRVRASARRFLRQHGSPT